MKQIYKIIPISALLLVANASYALKLDEALVKAYENHPELKIAQQEFLGKIQQYPETISETFLPDVRLTTSSAKGKSPGQNYQKNIKVTQNIFAGGSGVTGLAAVRHNIDVAKASYISKEQEFLFKAISVYTDYIVSKEKLESAKAFVTSRKKEYEANTEKMKLGELTQTEVAISKAQLAQALSSEASSHADYLKKKSIFKNYFGDDFDNIEMPEPASDLPKNFDEYYKLASSKNLNSKIANSQVKSAKNSLLASKGKLLPNLTAYATTATQISDSPIIPSKRKNKSYETTLQLTVPIFSSGGAEYSRIRRGKAGLRQAIYAKDRTFSELESSFISNWEQLQTAKLTITYTKDAMDAQSLALEGMKSKFEVGLGTIIDLLKEEKNYYDIIVENINAKGNLIKASYIIKSDLAQLTAKDLGLNVKIFDPEKEFKKTKFRIIGF